MEEVPNCYEITLGAPNSIDEGLVSNRRSRLHPQMDELLDMRSLFQVTLRYKVFGPLIRCKPIVDQDLEE